MKASEQQVTTYMWCIFGSSALWNLGIKHDRVCIVGVKLLRVLSHHTGRSQGHSPSYHPTPRQHPDVRFDPGNVLENYLYGNHIVRLLFEYSVQYYKHLFVFVLQVSGTEIKQICG